MSKDEEKIKQLLSGLKKEQQILFAVVCAKRFVGLYKMFDNEYDISKQDKSFSRGKGIDALIMILDFIDNKMESASENQIEDLISKNLNLVPDPELFDFDAKVYIAQLIAQSILNILRFGITNNIDKILFCTKTTLELINQIKGEEYYLNIAPTDAFNVPSEYLAPFFIKEIQLEEELIRMINDNSNEEKIKNFIDNNIIKW